MFSSNETLQLRFCLSRLSAITFVGLIIFFVRVEAIGTTKDHGPGSIDNWPSGFSPRRADMFVHNEIVIHASASTVWRYLVAAEQWPTWRPEAQNVRMLTPGHVLGRGSKFAWNTLGLSVESTVAECIPNQRLTWLSKTIPDVAEAYHVWLLIPVADGCKVATEKTEIMTNSSWADAAYATEHSADETWLNRLRAISESATNTRNFSSQGVQRGSKKSGT
jgi:uncharacterized protein YndB with AHSA1/START domain